jgi:hypothetical protein
MIATREPVSHPAPSAVTPVVLARPADADPPALLP